MNVSNCYVALPSQLSPHKIIVWQQKVIEDDLCHACGKRLLLQELLHGGVLFPYVCWSI